MKNEPSFEISQGMEVIKPKKTKAYPIPCREWDYLKKNINNIPEKFIWYPILATISLTISVSTFISTLLGNYSNKTIALAISASTLVIGLFCVFFSLQQKKTAETSVNSVIVQMNHIVELYPIEPESLNEFKDELVFSDNFETFSNWKEYGHGKIAHSKEYWHSGHFCLRKYGTGDPNGGFKEFNKQLGLGFIFTGWILSTSDRSGGQGDRLAIEDQEHSGYGFFINHGNGEIKIERRDKTKITPIGTTKTVELPKNVWFKFEFGVTEDHNIVFSLFYPEDTIIGRAHAQDEKYNLFTQVAIRGGSTYYVDDLAILKKKLKE